MLVDTLEIAIKNIRTSNMVENLFCGNFNVKFCTGTSKFHRLIVILKQSLVKLFANLQHMWREEIP